MQTTGCIFDIKRYAVHDGPGIRCSVYFKGCPLRCAWCHNPESQASTEQVLFTAGQCIGCGSCQNHTRPDLCPSKALEVCGATYTVAQVMDCILREQIFFDRSGGGVTFTGGEPLQQADMLVALLQQCGWQGIHRAVDTCLYVSAKTVDRVLGLTDLFLIDLKVMDSARHQFFTGVPNELIHSNIMKVALAGVPFAIRIPFVGGVNDTPQEIEAMLAFVCRLRNAGQLREVHILPYHNYGRHKLLRLNPQAVLPEDPFYTPTEETVRRMLDLYADSGIPAQQGG